MPEVNNTLYSKEVKQYISTRDWPKGLHFEITEVYVPAQHINIVFSRENWLRLNPDDHLKIVGIVKEIMSKLWTDGIPVYIEKME